MTAAVVAAAAVVVVVVVVVAAAVISLLLKFPVAYTSHDVTTQRDPVRAINHVTM